MIFLIPSLIRSSVTDGATLQKIVPTMHTLLLDTMEPYSENKVHLTQKNPSIIQDTNVLDPLCSNANKKLNISKCI